MHLAQREKNQSHDYSRGDRSRKGCGKNNFKARGVDTTMLRDLIFNVFIAERKDMGKKSCRIPWDKITKKEQNEDR